MHSQNYTEQHRKIIHQTQFHKTIQRGKTWRSLLYSCWWCHSYNCICIFYRFTKIGFEENVTRRRPITKNNVAPTYAKFAIIIIQVQTNKLYLYETNFWPPSCPYLLNVLFSFLIRGFKIKHAPCWQKSRKTFAFLPSNYSHYNHAANMNYFTGI